MSEPLIFLFAPVDAVGHFNASIGLAEQLLARGHKVVFAVPNSWRNKLAPQGFIEEWYSSTETTAEENSESSDGGWGDLASKMSETFAMTSIQQIKGFQMTIFTESVKRNKFSESQLKRIVKKVEPDVIVVDNACHQPALIDSGIPWVMSVSFNPLGISDKNVPPAFSGYPTNGPKDQWGKYRLERDTTLKDLIADFKFWVVQNGGPELNYPGPLFIKYSPWANIYMYPIELDYTHLRPNPPKFHRFDAFVRKSNSGSGSGSEVFELPEKFQSGPGKLVYFSMGTIGCSVLGMMRRLIAILGKSPNRFIVSKGPLGDQLELPDNMWGALSVPQPRVIQMVDLVLSHGGNNTVTETFYYGKPIIILPLFGDQLDNAQRVFETGLGLQFSPCTVPETELLEGMEKILADDLLAGRMKAIGNRIQSTNSQFRAADVIENVARENRLKRKQKELLN